MFRPATWLTCIALLWGVGCAPRALMRIAPPSAGAPSGSPSLSRAIDLGALAPAAEGALATTESDGALTAGEWIALMGDELGTEPTIKIAGRPVEVGGYLEGGLLVRLPRGVPAGLQTFMLDNGIGRATLDVRVASYLWGADVHDDSVRIRRMGPEHLGIDPHPFDLELNQARYTALAPEGGVLYALQEPSFASAFAPEIIESTVSALQSAVDTPETCELLVIHLGARAAPRPLTTLKVELGARPTGLAAGPGGRLVVFDRRQLTVFDASDPARPKLLSTLALAAEGARRELVDAEFLGDGRMLVVLEAFENRLHLVDLTDPSAPKLAGGLSLADAQDEPFSIDLAPAPGGKSLFVLQGPNLRLAGQKLRDGLSSVWTSAKVGFKRPPGAPEAAPGSESLSRVVEVTLGPDGLTLTRAVPLPSDHLPFFVAANRDGQLYVSALHGQNPFAGLTATAAGVSKLLTGLRDTAQFSRVLKLDPATGESSTVLQSIAIYYEVAVLPTGELIASLTRLGPGVLPPRVTLDWGFEIVDAEFVKVREVANTSFKLTQAISRLLPPFRYERIGTQ